MPLNPLWIHEYNHESDNTRKILEKVPYEKGDWKPHEKSMPLERLARHVAEMGKWVSITLNQDELDFAKGFIQTPKFSTTAELLQFFEEATQEAKMSLENSDDEKLNELWTMRNGDHIYFTMPRHTVLRNFAFNHLVHHRGQLSVYLRLLEVPLPGMYGPTADDRVMS